MTHQDLATRGSLGQDGSGPLVSALDGRKGHGSRAMAGQVSSRSGKTRVGAARNGSNGKDRQVSEGQGRERRGTAATARKPGLGSSRHGAEPSGVRESHVDPSKAERLRPVMARLAEAGNGTARALIDEARAPSSSIHDCFEWNDTKAGEKWRLHQATNYWGSIRVEVQMPNGPLRAPGFIPIVVNNEQTYRPIEQVASNVDWRKQMMAQATRELGSWQSRYDALASVASMKPIFKAIKVVTGK